MTDAPEHADLTGVRGEWRDLFWNRDVLGLVAQRWRLDGSHHAGRGFLLYLVAGRKPARP